MMGNFARVEIKYLAGVFFSVWVGIMVYGMSQVDEPTVASMCSPDDYSVRIIDDSVTSEAENIKSVNDPNFRSFIMSMTDYIASKFSGTTPCKGSLINLVFVRLPLVTSGDSSIAPPPTLKVSSANLNCRLDSPWVKFAVRRSNSPLVDAVFIWNERQFLLDQVLLSGDRPSVSEPLLPLSNSSFERYALDYGESEVEGIPSVDSVGTVITERIPADILWLFRNSPKTTFIPFSSVAHSQMQEILKSGTNGYTSFHKVIIDQCFSAEKTDIHYKNILDLNKIFSLDQYRVN